MKSSILPKVGSKRHCERQARRRNAKTLIRNCLSAVLIFLFIIAHDQPSLCAAARRKTSSFVKPNCGVQTTSWTSCSKTCGLGLATRVTNNNPSCKLTRESRLCNLRPCDNADYATPKVRRIENYRSLISNLKSQKIIEGVVIFSNSAFCYIN